MHKMFAPIVIFWLSLLGLIFASFSLMDVQHNIFLHSILSGDPPDTIPYSVFSEVLEKVSHGTRGAFYILAVVFLLQFISVIWLTLVFKQENGKSN